MYTSVIVLTVVFIVLLLYVFFKYNLDARDDSEYDKMYREKLDISPSEAAYLENKNCSSLNLILADILSLKDKGYITMEVEGTGIERDYLFITKDTNDNGAEIKSHELSSYRLFFGNQDRIRISKYIREIKRNKERLQELELKSISIKKDIEFELRRQEITDVKAEKKLFKFHNFSIRLIFLFLLAIIITAFTKNLELIEFSVLGMLFSILLFRTTTLKEDKLTKYGVETRKKAIGFKKYIEQYLIAEDRPLYTVNILEYNYVMAVAFGYADLGEKEFVHKTYRNIQIKKVLSFLITVGIVILIIALEIEIIKGEICQLMS